MGQHFTAYQNRGERPLLKLQPGDILVFKRNARDQISRIFSWLLQRFERGWDRWGWHTGYVSDVSPDGTITTAEAAIGKGVQTVVYPTLESLGEVRVYRWLDGLSLDALEAFTQEHLGRRYHLACYFWTSLQRILLRLSDRLVPRKLNDKYTCWELVCAMARAMERPLQPIDRYPLIADMVKTLESVRIA